GLGAGRPGRGGAGLGARPPARPAGRRPDDRGPADRRRHRVGVRDGEAERGRRARGDRRRVLVSSIAPPFPAPTARRGPIEWARGWIEIYATTMRIATAQQFPDRGPNHNSPIWWIG